MNATVGCISVDAAVGVYAASAAGSAGAVTDVALPGTTNVHSIVSEPTPSGCVQRTVATPASAVIVLTAVHAITGRAGVETLSAVAVESCGRNAPLRSNDLDVDEAAMCSA